MFSFLKLLSPAYRKRRASVLRFRQVKPWRRKLYRHMARKAMYPFMRPSPFAPFRTSRPLPVHGGDKIIQFIRYAEPETSN